MSNRATDGSRSILAARIAPPRSTPVRKASAARSLRAGAALEEDTPPAPPRWERRRCWPSARSEQIGRRLAPRRERTRKVSLPRPLTGD